MTKLWGGRFEKTLSQAAKQLSFSFELDKRLYQQDIAVNKAHAKALEKAGILSAEESHKIVLCLDDILERFPTEIATTEQPDEDIHSCIERLVTEALGDLGKKLHTGKSRNDQVCADTRLFLKSELLALIEKIEVFLRVICEVAEAHQDVYFPGFTHLQVAQPIMLSHHFLAYFEKFERDKARLEDVLTRVDVCPLGSAAFAGSNYPLDREFIKNELGFSKLTQNSMDGVSARDFILEYFSAAAICISHFSQLSEELILWCSPTLGWVEIGEEYTTGSSIMPQKKNPDIAELTRGKAGTFLSHFVALHELVKGLPLTYNRDLQDDKVMLFQNCDLFHIILECYIGMLPTLKFNQEKIQVSLKQGFALATEIADYLAMKGMPFREAHEITGQIVRYAIDHGVLLEEISLETYQRFSKLFDSGLIEALTFESSVKRKSCLGGTAPTQIQSQIRRIKESYKW